jgi:hypothetical protein
MAQAADFFRRNVQLRIVLEFEVGSKVHVEFCILNIKIHKVIRPEIKGNRQN